MLSPRQELLLGKVVDGFAETGQPVGSKALAGDADVLCGPSTIRNELAVLEEQGLLAHPHTSAGRVPTDSGYRYFVDRLLPVPAQRSTVDLSLVRRDVDDARRRPPPPPPPRATPPAPPPGGAPPPTRPRPRRGRTARGPPPRRRARNEPPPGPGCRPRRSEKPRSGTSRCSSCSRRF